MTHELKYCIVLLPSREIPRRDYSLREAAAWISTYNQIMEGRGKVAAIVEERQETKRQETRRRWELRRIA
jgi:hypothetical protein